MHVVRLLRVAGQARELFKATVVFVPALFGPNHAEKYAIVREAVMAGRAAAVLYVLVTFEPAEHGRHSAAVSIWTGNGRDCPALVPIRVIAMIDRLV